MRERGAGPALSRRRYVCERVELAWGCGRRLDGVAELSDFCLRPLELEVSPPDLESGGVEGGCCEETRGRWKAKYE